MQLLVLGGLAKCQNWGFSSSKTGTSLPRGAYMHGIIELSMKSQLWNMLPMKVCDAVWEPITRLAHGWDASPGRGWVQQAEFGELRVACLSPRQRKERVQGVMECKQSSRCWQVPWLGHKESGGRTRCKTLWDDMDRAVPLLWAKLEPVKPSYTLVCWLSSLSRRRASSQIISQSHGEMLRF